MMCVAAIAVATVTWALVGYSLAFDGPAATYRRARQRRPPRRRVRPRAGTDDPRTCVFFAFQATFCIITVALVSGAVVERMRFGAFLVFAALWSVLVYAVLAHWAFGGGWLLGERHARLRRRRPGRDGLGLLGARGGAGRRRAQGLRPPGAAAAQRGLRAARRRPAVVRLVRLQRRQRLLDRQRQRARLHQHAARRPACALVVWFVARPDPRPSGDGDRRRDRDHRRLRADHARGRLRQPRLGDGARRPRRAALLRDDRLAAADAGRRDARRARRARDRRLHRHPLHRLRRPGLLERRLRRPLLRQRRPARRPGAGGDRGARLRVRRHLRAAEADRRRSPRCAPASTRRRSGWTSSTTARRPTSRARARS